MHKQMVRASLSRFLVRSPRGSRLRGCLADAIRIISEPRDPAPLIESEGVRGPGDPEQMLGTVFPPGRPLHAPQLQREDGGRTEVTGMRR